jgi:nicotinamidase-related amidase
MAAPNTALFVIDIQNFLATDPATSIPHSERLKAAVQEILSTARSLNSVEGGKSCPIVFVQHEQVSEAGSLQRGTEPWELVFKPVDGASNEIIVSKTTGIAAHDTTKMQAVSS